MLMKTKLTKMMCALFAMTVCTSAWATGGTISGNGSQANPYLLADAADWAVFTTEGNHATYWASGVYVKMTADIGTNVNPVTTKVGTYSHMFKGVFDGDGHTLTVSLTGGDYTAPFYYVENARIIRLTTAGNVTADAYHRQYLGGLVGHSYGASIEYCVSNVSLIWPYYESKASSTYSGGLVGQTINGTTTTIKHSAFTGSFNQTVTGEQTVNLYNMAGFVGYGYGTMVISDCLNAGTFPNANICKVARVGNNVSITVKNCYSTTDAVSNGSLYYDGGTYTDATGADLVALLGSGWELVGGEPAPMTDETDLGTATVSGIDEYYLLDGTVQHPEPTVTDLFGNVLVKGTHYNVDWNGDGTIVGDYNVTVSGIGTYHGTYTTGYTVTEGIAVTSSTTTLEDGLFYKVYEDVTNNNRITVNGTALLTLGTGATLTASKGIRVEDGNTLTIRGEGSLTAIITEKNSYYAAIGSTSSSTASGTIIINGGNITATAYQDYSHCCAAGIGGASGGACGRVEINGGVVTATGGQYGCGIGGGGNYGSYTGGAGGTIVINGGQVTATSPSGNGIGSGKSESGTADGTAGNIDLSWTAADDFIDATSFAGTVTLNNTFFYEDGTTGVTLDNLASHVGEKIIPSTATTANNLAYATISGVQDTYIYTGSTIAITPTVTSFLGTALTLGTDYDVTYSPATIQAQGDYTLTISPSTGSTYTNSLSIGFTVTDNLQSTGSGYYVNLPKTGAKEASLVAHHVAKVYDDGGSAGRYSDNADGTLLLSAPAGYVIRLSGTIDVADENDVLTVYNGSTTSDASLGSFNADGSVNVVSTGTQMLVRFASDAYATASGLDLTATAIQSGANINLSDNADNSATIALYNGVSTNITLSGRTFYQDGKWNTICLPFNVTLASSPLSGATLIEMDNSSTGTSLDTSNGELTLKFSNATNIEAGKPYLIKWDAGENIVSPTFNGVTITSTTPTSVVSHDNKLKFVGQYNPYSITDANIDEVILLTNNNKLGYSNNPRTLNCFRAHFFAPKDGDMSRSVKQYSIEFGNGQGTTGITEMRSETEITRNGWYTLDGRCLQDKPSAKGVYIMNGKKVIIK